MQTFFARLLDTVGTVAFAAFVLSALYMIFLWVTSMYGWLGGWGAGLAVVGAPLAAVYPFTEWWVEGSPSGRTFAIWGVGVLGVVVGMGRVLLPRRQERDSG